MLLTGVPGLPQSIEIDWMPDKNFGQGFIGAPAAVRGWGAGGVEWRGGKLSNRLSWSLLQSGGLGLGNKLVPYMG